MANLQKIKQLAAEKNILLGDICEKAGISRQGLARIMRENVTTTDTLEKICNILGCTPEELLDIETKISVTTNNGNVVGVGTIEGGNVARALDILHEQLRTKDSQIDGLIRALQNPKT